MSPFYVKYFKSTNPCPRCSSKVPGTRAPQKSLCGAHLRIARVAFRLWSIQRRRQGRCLACDREALKFNCRCPVHREQNRLKCRRWDAAHPEAHDRAYLKVLARINAGFCRCSATTPLAPGQKRCDTCKVRDRAYKSGKRAVILAYKRRRLATKKAKEKELEKGLKAELRALGFVATRGPAVRRV